MRLGPLLVPLILTLLGSCATPSPHRRVDVAGLIREARHYQVTDAQGFRFAKFAFSELPAALQRVCMAWPLENRNQLSSPFGRRWGRKHDGMDLRAKQGTGVLAALPGLVIYSGDEVRGYGNLVIIKHARNLHTVYAHHRENIVTAGQWVRAQDQIAWSGASGRTTGPHLHFEVREGQRPLDPLKMMAVAVRKNSEDLCM